jgi:hypothetical protein
MNPTLAFWLAMSSLPALLPAQTLAELTAVLARAASVDDEAVGFAGATSDTWRAYERWRGLATGEELRELTRHEHPNVRVYAVRALVETGAATDFVAIMKERLVDAAAVTTFSGCTLQQQLAGDVVFTTLRPRLTDEQMLDLAEALLAQQSPLAAREWVLRNLRLRDGMLHRVRALAKGGDGPAAIALARYGLPGDVPILIQHLRAEDPFATNTQFLAAAIHKDAKLLAPLVDLEAAASARIEHDNPSRLRFWLQAIAAQRSAEAGRFLLRFLQDTRPADPFREKDLLGTYKQVLVEHAACPEFEAVRAELQRRHAAAAK